MIRTVVIGGIKRTENKQVKGSCSKNIFRR